MSIAIIVQRVSSPVLSWTVIILSVSLLHLGSSTAASQEQKVTQPRSPDQSHAFDQRTIAHLSRRFDILLDELRQTSKKTRLAIEAAATFEQESRAPEANHREELRRRALSKRDEAAKSTIDWMDQFDVLFDLHTRLDNLRSLLRLRDETRRLQTQRTELDAKLHSLETQLSAKRDELYEEELFARLGETSLKELGEESDFMKLVRGADHQTLRGVAAEEVPEHLRIPDSKLDLKATAAWTKEARAKANSLRSEAKDLWGKKIRLWNEILDLDVSLRTAQANLDYLEKSRESWDRDKPVRNRLEKPQ